MATRASLWAAPETLEIVSFLNTFMSSENYPNQVPFTLDDLEAAVTGFSGESAAQQVSARRHLLRAVNSHPAWN